MLVLGIDPGSRRCGYGAVRRTGSRLEVVAAGVIAPGDRAPLAVRLAALLEGLEAVLARVRADAVAVESAYCGVSPRSALVLGQARGVVLVAAARAGLPIHEYAPAQVKRAFTGSGRASKEQMLRTAAAMLGIAATRSDEADALAVALCHLGQGASRPELQAASRARIAGARATPFPAVRDFRAGTRAGERAAR